MRPSLAASLLLLCPAAQVSLLAQAQNPMALQAVPADAQDAATGRGLRGGGATPTATAPDADGAMFRGGAAHTGVYSATGIAAFHKVKWEFQAKGQILSSPVAAGNIVYVGSNDHRLYAVELGSGEKKWEFKTEGRVVSSPAVSNGVVYFLSYDSNLYAVDAASGALK